MPLPVVSYYLHGRLIEWSMSVGLVINGLSMLLWPMTDRGSILHVLVGVLGGPLTGLLFLNVGMFSIVALIVNGRSIQIGPWVRGVSASIRAVIWTTFVLSMVRISINQGFVSPMVPFWSAFTVAEVYISYRAVLDVRDAN